MPAGDFHSLRNHPSRRLARFLKVSLTWLFILYIYGIYVYQMPNIATSPKHDKSETREMQVLDFLQGAKPPRWHDTLPIGAVDTHRPKFGRAENNTPPSLLVVGRQYYAENARGGAK